MKITEFVKAEISGWQKVEVFGLFAVILFILYNAFFLHDNFVAVFSAIFGILYTIIAGKGKISCYFFGLMGSGCYIWLSSQNLLWGNTFLYLLYYIPMQIHGIFNWKDYLNPDTKEIVKIRLSAQERILLALGCIVGCVITVITLYNLQDSNPVIDGITTFLSIAGMYLTVRRAVEQWVVWIIVNGLSFLMWLGLVVNGTKAYSTLVMWGVYFVLAIYFYIVWQKDLRKSLSD